ncbi:ABC-type dipeptide/oligopeptide/nickel transport system permease component [Clostridium tetanomorphum]|uniref:Uncharacterized protein n=1 Tax=Clostridium tetanomorphum TaxID=1553 RepID=A0A923IZ59_CLOTT|nr:hypothetical protein [Clostridium tetanomorphum]KAJ52036.1 hypothetical protein CTM_09696 [Clostridium tetanomorphum DSM 665]MBC2397046.1 hypothetical protein [Clostridium tetanomorphum]MBP1862956.1 ABC-type dipeptide/oligopeptide/nickel transport system permease component [Clostridium tetanomorphum]NRS82785.1 ABC-type dipeptide/oligopeptide/nickel transport system permease component [Clostridium tetanomorphum]NRS87094.1 ABC-type dipeptide/oligopeptide/nickel transport system permease compo
MKKKIVSIISTLMISFLVSTSASAKVASVLVKDTNTYYQYYYDDIRLAAEDKALGLDSQLYDEYVKRSSNVISLRDDLKGYVDYKAIKIAAENAAVFNQTFNLDSFTSNVSGSDIISITFDIQQRIVKDGKVVDGGIIKPGQQEFDVVDIY